MYFLIHPKGWIDDESMAAHCQEEECICLDIPYDPLGCTTQCMPSLGIQSVNNQGSICFSHKNAILQPYLIFPGMFCLWWRLGPVWRLRGKQWKLMMDELGKWLLASYTPLLTKTLPALSTLCLLSNVQMYQNIVLYWFRNIKCPSCNKTMSWAILFSTLL